jgi:hypothetical protein
LGNGAGSACWGLLAGWHLGNRRPTDTRHDNIPFGKYRDAARKPFDSDHAVADAETTIDRAGSKLHQSANPGQYDKAFHNQSESNPRKRVEQFSLWKPSRHARNIRRDDSEYRIRLQFSFVQFRFGEFRFVKLSFRELWISEFGFSEFRISESRFGALDVGKPPERFRHWRGVGRKHALSARSFIEWN